MAEPLLIPQPIVSVIMTSYNREGYLAQAIESVLSQKCSFSYEIIIGDDFSTDGTRDMLLSYRAKYPDRFVLNFQKHNVGVGPNWASTVKMARGQYLAFLDDDDWWHDCEKLQKQVDYFEANPQIGVCDSDYRTYNESIGEYSEIVKPYSVLTDVKQAIFSGKCQMYPSTVMLRKDVLDQWVNLDDFIKLNFPLQDWSTFMLMSDHTQFGHLSSTTTTYRTGTESMSRPKRLEVLEERLMREKRMYQYVCAHCNLPYDEAMYDSHINHCLMSLAFRNRDFANAKKYGALCKEKTLKRLCSTNKLAFKLWLCIKKLKKCLLCIMAAF